MKSLFNYIINERLKLNSDSVINSNSASIFNSHITNNPIEINTEWLIGSYNWKQSRIAILIEYAKECLKLLKDKDDIEFVKNWLSRAKNAHNLNGKNFYGGGNSQGKEFRWLCNGEKYNFGNAKFTYDLLQYALTKPDITKPRRQKVEKILRDEYHDVEINKDKMNWY